MADFNALQAIINAYIKRNGVQAITGQILNGVLTGMVNALGKGYTVAGAASPTTDPGTMTGPLAYIAYTAGTYTHFDNIVVEQGEVSMLIYNEAEWHKEVLFSLAAQATVDDNIGVPSVGVSFVDGLLTFDFRNMKGEPGENGQDGDPAGFGTISASISGGVGTPSVSVQSSGPDTAKNIAFQFTNLKGETGVTSCVVTVDNTTGNPSCAVSLVGQELHLDFSGLKGAQGNTGSSVDYPFTIVNNLTTDDATQALSAAMGVQLESEVSQLEAKVTDLDEDVNGVSYICRNAFIGGWNISPSGYSKATNVNRVGLGEFRLNSGDKIKLSDYTACRMYVGWRNDDGTFGTSGAWLTQDFTASASATYVVTLEGIPASAVSATEDLTQYVSMDRSVTAFDILGYATQNASHLALVPAAINVPKYTLKYDSTNDRIEIRSQTTIVGLKTSSGYKGSGNIYLNALTNTTAQLIVYDTINDSFRLEPFNVNLPDTVVVLGTFRRYSSDLTRSSFATTLPWEVDGRPYNIFPNIYSFIGVIPSGASNPYCNYDTQAQTFTIPADTLLVLGRIDGNKDYYKVPSDVVIDLTQNANTSVKILFDYDTKTFKLYAHTAVLEGVGYSLFCTIRKTSGANTPAVTAPFPWSIDGCPYGIKTIPNVPTRKGFTKGINQRGYNTVAPENTIPAFKLSAKWGFDYVETDVRFTSDNVPVLLHDSSINRTARNMDGTEIGTTIEIANITYQDALDYDFGIWKGATYAGTQIPTFEEFVALCRNLGLNIYIELKTGTQAQIEGLVDIVRKYGMSGKATWISFGDTYLSYIVGYDETARVGLIATVNATIISAAENLMTGKNEVFLDSGTYTSEEIALCSSAKIPMEVWTIDAQNTIKSLDGYISGVTSNILDASSVLYDTD